VLVPPGVLTVTSTVPVPAGAVAVIEVGEPTLKLVAAVEPNFTAVASWSSVPVIVTVVPPAVGPLAGSSFVTVGALASVLKVASEPELVPPGPVAEMRKWEVALEFRPEIAAETDTADPPDPGVGVQTALEP
jgi:hypothetical protein